MAFPRICCYETALSSHVISSTILEINYVHFLQFQRDLIPQGQLEEDFIYRIALNKRPTSNKRRLFSHIIL